MPYDCIVEPKEFMTSQENLKMIMESMDKDTKEIVHVVLKSQVKRKQKSMWMKR